MRVIPDHDLGELLVKVRTLFFFVHDLDERFDRGDAEVQPLIEGWFDDRFGLDPARVRQVLPFLQAKTLLWFLFPVLSVLRRSVVQGLPQTAPEAWDVEMRNPDGTLIGQEQAMGKQIDIMRNAVAHILEHGDRDPVEIDLDAWTFRARSGQVKFRSQEGFVACFEALLEHARHHAGHLVDRG